MNKGPLTLASQPAAARVTVRHGSHRDVAAALDLHRRCSPDALRRRFHASGMRLPPRVMERLLVPRRGFSLLALDGGEVVAMACAAELEPGRLELGMLVRDDWQDQGIGSRLVRMVADEGIARGYTTMLASTQPDNHGVLGMLRRAGLEYIPRTQSGQLELDIALTEPATLPRSA